MKQIIYLTKNKVWFEGVPADWMGSSLTEVFKANKQKLDASDVKIVLGNDVSFIASFPKSKLAELTRENIWTETKNHMPIEVDEECFDWSVVMVDKEAWIQSVAVEKEFLQNVSRAALESGVKVSLMIPIGVLIGQRSVGKEVPMLIKWSGIEKLSVLANRGLVDSVFLDVSDEQIVTFAKNKWALTADPEVLMLDDTTFNLSEEAFKENVKGSDEEILNIPVFRNLDPVQDKSVTTESIPGGISFEADKKPKLNNKIVTALLIVAILLVFGIGGWILFGPKKTNDIKKVVVPAVTVTPTITPTPTATSAATVDLSNYSIQVLNGSGITGLAAGVKDSLITSGFAIVDIGNAPETVEGSMQIKPELPAEVITKAKTSVASFVINDADALTKDNKYDLVIVLGSEKN